MSHAFYATASRQIAACANTNEELRVRAVTVSHGSTFSRWCTPSACTTLPLLTTPGADITRSFRRSSRGATFSRLIEISLVWAT